MSYIKSLTAVNGVALNNMSYSGPYITGMIRWNGNTQTMEVMDGQNWQTLNGAYPNIEMDPGIYKWARKKMAEEAEIDALCDKHPGLKEAYERFQIMKVLATEEEKPNAVV
jgi:hypothetical protein